MRGAEGRAGLPPSPPLPGALQTWLTWRWPFSFLSALRRRCGTRFTAHALARPPLVFLRTMLSPAFSRPAVDEHAEIVRELAEREITTWPRDVPFALHARLHALTLRVILHTLFGRDVEQAPELHGRLLSMHATAGTGLTLPASRSPPGGRASWQPGFDLSVRPRSAQRCGLVWPVRLP